MEYLESLKELSNSSAYRCEDGEDWGFLEQYSKLFKKYFTQLHDSQLKKVSVELLENWISSNQLDNFIDAERISYSKAFQKIMNHIPSNSSEKQRNDVMIELGKKLKPLEIVVNEYCENDTKLSSIPKDGISVFYSTVLEPSLNIVLDKVTDITEFVLKYICFLKDKEFIQAINKALSAFYKTIFDCTSEDANRNYLAYNYETLRILLFLAGQSELDLF